MHVQQNNDLSKGKRKKLEKCLEQKGEVIEEKRSAKLRKDLSQEVAMILER
jgi:hypothetical protein